MEAGSGYILEVQCPNVDFDIEFYVERERSVKFSKDELLKVTTAEGVKHFAMIETSKMGRGSLMARAVVKDKEPHWGERPVVISGFTGYVIGNCLCGIGGGFGCSGYSFAFRAVNDIPTDVNAKIYYGVIKEWVTDYKYITEEMVESLNVVPVGELSKVAVEMNAGDRLVVLVPRESGMVATKEGLGESEASTAMPFSTNIMGANGELEISVKGVKYKIYGEFLPVKVKMYINIG